MPRAYRSHKRRVNTCSECRRRKQRCNRRLPCHYCNLRGTPEKCVFSLGDSPSVTIDSRPDTYRSDQDEHDPERRVNAVSTSSLGDQDNEEIVHLPSQIGYQVNRNYSNQAHVVNEIRAHAVSTQASSASNLLHPHRIGKDKWSRYCQISISLPERSIVQNLVNVFFDEANWYFTVLDRYFFDDAYRKWLLISPTTTEVVNKGFAPDDLFFPALLQQILAIAIHFVPEQSILASSLRQLSMPSNDDLSRDYSDAGEAILDLLGRHHHSVVAVQADLMRCAWLKNSGQGSRAWYSLGSAIRQAQDIGLHLEPVTSNLGQGTQDELSGLWRNEFKRRLWACLFTWESHMALQLGRPCTIHVRDCTVAMLISADIPQEPSRTLFRPQAVDEGPPRSSSQIVKYVLAQKIQDLMASRAFHPDFQKYSLIQATHQEVDELLLAVSPCLRIDSPDVSWDVVRPDTVLHRLQIAIIANSFLLSLHRPHVKHHRESFDAAIEAAVNVLDCSQALFEKLPRHQHKTFTLIFYTIDAGILAAAIAATLRKDDFRLGNVRQSLLKAIGRLDVLSQRNTAAAAGSKALSKCVQKFFTKEEASSDNFLVVRTQLAQAASPDHYHGQSEPQPNGRLEGDLLFHQADQHSIQNNIDDWDFLPTFGDPEDILTAITIDSGYTSSWLEQSLESLTSWE